MLSLAAEISSSYFRVIWDWVIEYLASFPQIDLSIINGLIDAFPGLPERISKNTREIIALKCLEYLFVSSNEPRINENYISDPNVSFHISTSCEDVLLSILQEKSIDELKTSGPEMLNWDFHPFIIHKRATMPKCSLEHLKDSILDGSHPHASFLMDLSRLLHMDNGNEVISAPGSYHSTDNTEGEEEKVSVDGNFYNQNSCTQKRNWCDLANGNTVQDHREGRVFVDHIDADYLHYKQLKQVFSCPSNYDGNKLASDSSNPMIGVTEEENEDDTENGADGPLEGQNAASRDAFVSKTYFDGIAGEAEDIWEGYASGDGYGWDDEMVDVEMKKLMFMSSQCTPSLDSIMIADFTEEALCFKCAKDGKILGCSADGCPLSVHEKCLGPLHRFDDRGNFYCPFCACSRATSEYLEAKKLACIARKELADFIHLGFQHQPSKQEEKAQSERHKSSSPNGCQHLPNEIIEKCKLEKEEGIEKNNLTMEIDVAMPSNGAGTEKGPNLGTRNMSAEDNQEKENIIKCQLGGCGMPHDQASAYLSCSSDPRLWNNRKIVFVNYEKHDVETKSDVIKQQVINSRDKLVSAVDFTIARCGDEEDSLSPVVSQLKEENKVNEEEILKESKRRFSRGQDGNISYKKIMKHGYSVFLDGRSKTDHKKVWENKKRKQKTKLKQ